MRVQAVVTSDRHLKISSSMFFSGKEVGLSVYVPDSPHPIPLRATVTPEGFLSIQSGDEMIGQTLYLELDIPEDAIDPAKQWAALKKVFEEVDQLNFSRRTAEEINQQIREMRERE